MTEESITLRERLLLASPGLADGTFDHSVIILDEHTANGGAHGVIINQPTGNTVGELLKDPAFSALGHLPVFRGGPLSGEELMFSAFSVSTANRIVRRTCLSAETASELIKRKGHIVRATLGHSAWSPGQLENELQRNTWITLRPSNELLAMQHDVSLWKNLLKGISPYHHLLSQAPQNPFLN
jgi:putative transcriptional regulator